MPNVEAMLAEVEPLLVQIIRKRCRGWPAPDREDIEQEVRIVLWQKSLPKFDPTRGTLKSFAGQAITNAITDQLRKLQRERGLRFTDAELDNLPSDEPVISDDSEEQMQTIFAALNDMKQADAQLVRALLSGGKDTDSTVTAASKWTRKSRILSRLRSIIRSRTDRPAA